MIKKEEKKTKKRQKSFDYQQFLTVKYLLYFIKNFKNGIKILSKKNKNGKK